MRRCLCGSVFSGFDTIPAYDVRTDGRTDGHTDGRTDDDSIYRASIASRGKNERGTIVVSVSVYCGYQSGQSSQLLT